MATSTNTSKVAILMIMAMQIIVMEANNYGGGGDHVICGISTEDMFKCRPAVVAPTPLPPSLACCEALKGADLPCLCSFYKNSKSLLAAFGIDPALAMQLPAKCNLLQYSSHC